MEIFIKMRLTDEERLAIAHRCGFKKLADRELAKSILSSLLESDLQMIVSDYRSQQETKETDV